MKKIVIIARNMQGGGVYRFTRNLLLALDQLPEASRIYFVHNQKALARELTHIRPVYISCKNRLLFDYFFSFIRIWQIKPHAVVYTKNIIPLIHVFHPAKKFNVIHDLGYFIRELNAYPFQDTLYMRAFMKLSCLIARRVIAVSDSTRSEVERILNIRPHKIAVIHEGVEAQFKPIEKEESRKQLSQKYSVKLPYIFYAGSLSPRKNMRGLLRAFSQIKDKIPHQLVMTGLSGWETGYEFEFASQHLGSRLHVTGFLPEADLVRFYNLADLFVYPSFYEGFGLPVLEAQACGCPVVASNRTSCPEVGGSGAFYFNPEDDQGMAYAILEVLQNNDLRSELVEKGYKNAAGFRWSSTAMKLLDLLKHAS